jgi:hypothetical protein
MTASGLWPLFQSDAKIARKPYRMAPSNTPEFWTPERRTAQRTRSKEVSAAYYANPMNLARRGFLQAHEKAQVVAMARAGVPYIQIALEYLISEGRVSKITQAAGYRRQPRPWTPSDKAIVAELWNAGRDIAYIAGLLARSRSAISCMAAVLDLPPRNPTASVRARAIKLRSAG